MILDVEMDQDEDEDVLDLILSWAISVDRR